MTALGKFQQLLRTLFQFDCADLDFGIYRILNYKRECIETLIDKRLPQIVDKAFADFTATDKVTIEQKIERVRQQIRESIGEQAFNKQGKLKQEFRETPLGKQYLDQCDKQAKYEVAGELKTRIYNDLYNFFSRYYEDGDFISKRRYGQREAYAVPYNGEDVVLHWANKDQYYIKTGEQFKTYRFKVEGGTVAFELRNAGTEQNNNKGHKRYFVLASKKPVQESNGLLQIFFEYRPLTEKEQKTFGKNEQQRPQENLNARAAQTALKLVKNPILRALQAQTDNGQTLLLKHLTQFTRKNTSDFFIHKDLRSFLRRELDFYLKNEVLLLDELLNATNPELATQRVLQGHVIRKVGEAIIDFLAQVENFQRRLFVKKKFVVRTEYCLTIDRVPEELWDEVLKSKTQFAELQKLFMLDELLQQSGKKKPDKEFLKTHPKLVVDTRYFSEDFKWRLLSHFDDLDNALDGVLIKSENFQALNLLIEKHRGKLKCIYIDPPYNTSENSFVYKNSFKHSSWITMIQNRLELARKFLATGGVIEVAIDDTETSYLRSILSDLFNEDNRVATMAIEVNPAGQNLRPNTPSLSHDYCLVYANDIERMDMLLRELTDDEKDTYVEKDEKGFFLWDNLRRRGGNSRPKDRPNQWFPLYVCVEKNRVSVEPFNGAKQVWPVDPKGEKRIWRVNPGGARREIAAGEISVFEKAGRIEVVKKTRMPEGKKPKTLWKESKYSATTYGTKLLMDVLGKQVFSYPKSLFLVMDCLRFWSDEFTTTLDYFAGSGTTAHAVINLNREDDGTRKYILVEVSDYFDTVLLPRIKKVVFCENWKDGKPAGGKGVSHFVKYLTLEQYEDTLNNLAMLREEGGQRNQQEFGDDYLLRYMLEFETQGSACQLNLDMMKNPFDYRLKVQAGDEIVERTVDLIETFNYLLGLHVRKMLAFENDGRPYRAVSGEQNGKRVAIIWRPLNGLEENKTALRRDKQFIEDKIFPALLGNDARPDRLLVNGACHVENAEAIEPEFKRLMFKETV